MRSPSIRLRRALGFVVLAWLMAIAGSNQVFAHAALVASTPADGAVVEVAPDRFILRFNEPVAPLVLRLIAPDGAPIALDRPAATGQILEIDAPEGLGIGTHILSWRVVSEDGHPVGGSVLFSIGAPLNPPAAASALEPERPIAKLIWLAKLALYIGLFAGVGGAFFLCWIAEDRSLGRGFVGATLMLGALTALASTALLGLDALDLPLRAIGSAEIWRAGFEASFGRTALIAIGSIFLAFSALRFARNGRFLSFVALIGVGAALAASGHASSAQPQWLTRPALLLHGVGVAFWVGALVPLFLALKRRDATLQRFSKAIPIALVPLVLSGAALAWVQLERASALIDTQYGWVLCAKLFLVVVLLGLAALNRWRLSPAAVKGDAGAREKLRGMILAEVAVVILALGVIGLWRFTPPPRALPPTPVPILVTLSNEAALAQAAVTETRPGVFSLALAVLTADRKPIDPLEVTLGFADPSLGVEAITRFAQRDGEGGWRIDDLVLPERRRWLLTAEILISDFEMVTLAAPLDLTDSPTERLQPDWPFPIQPSLTAMAEPSLWDEVLTAAALTAGALVILGLALFQQRWRRWVLAGAAVAVIAANAPSLGLLIIPAYPTSLYQSPTGNSAASILRGAILYPIHCASCHGAEGRGDGPLAERQRTPPADLTADHLWDHSDGELFWWLSHGITAPNGALSMPGFAAALSPRDRWHLIDYLHANAAAHAAR